MYFVFRSPILDASSRAKVSPPANLIWIKQVLLAAFVAMASGVVVSASAEAAPTYELKPKQMLGQVQRIKVISQVQGKLKLNPDGKKVVTKPLAVSGEIEYDEKILPAPASQKRRSVRWYRQTKVDINVDGNPFSPKLRDDCRLIVAQTEGNDCLLVAPLDQLTREELELIDIQGCSLCLDGLLPEGKVKVGEGWQPKDATIAQLLGLEAVSLADIHATLRKVEDGLAVIELEGKVTGAVGGIASEIDIMGKLTYNLAEERVTWLAMNLKEDRSIGHAEPGFELSATLRMALSHIGEPPELSAKNLQGLSLDADAGAALLDFESTAGGYGLLHDRRWRVMTDTADVTVMRLVDKGDLIAQCNISPLPKLEEGHQLELEAFQTDIKQVIGDKFGQFVDASQGVAESGLRVLRVTAMGTVSELPVQWTYYHFSDDSGRRAACVFTLEAELVERFAETDRTFGSSFRFVGLPADAGEEKSEAADEEKLQAAKEKPDGGEVR